MQKEIFKPSEDLVFSTVQANKEGLMKHLQTSLSNHFYLDLREVVQCDSAGLAWLIEAKRLCRNASKHFEIIGMSQGVLALIEFCGLQTILTEL